MSFHPKPGAFELLGIFLILVAAACKKIDGHRAGEALATAMRTASQARATRYRWIERSMRRHLRDEQEADSSLINVLIHPKVDPLLSQTVLKACAESKSALVWQSTLTSSSHGCRSNVTCYKINRVIGIYAHVDDIKPREWVKSYGRAWNPRSKIAIWLDSSGRTDETTARIKYEEVLSTFWSINVLNVVLLVSPTCSSNDHHRTCDKTLRPRVFGYDPFQPRPGRPERRGRLFERSADDPLFPDKLTNLHGIPIRISMYQQEPHAVLANRTTLGTGIESNNVRYISRWLNFTVALVTSPGMTFTSYAVELPNGEKIGAIGDIVKNRSVYLANSEYVQNTLGHRVEFLRPFSRAYVKFLVPPAGTIPGIFRVFRSIDVAVGGLTFGICLLLVAYFMARKTRHPWLNTFRLLLHSHIVDISESTSERIFLIFWILWAFILNTAGQSYIIKDLTSPPFYKSIDTLKELAASPLTPMLGQVDINSLKYSDNKVRNSLAARAHHEPDFDRCTDVLVAHGNVTCAIDALYIAEAEKNLNAKEGRRAHVEHTQPVGRTQIVHVAREILTEYWRTIVVQDGFPYLNKFNAAYDRIIELGLKVKWLSDSARQPFDTNPASGKHPKLSMSHFEGTFKLLLIGLIAAFVAFLGEFVLHWARKRFGILPSARDRDDGFKWKSLCGKHSRTVEIIEHTLFGRKHLL